jgi:voltage-gated sodium channel
LVPFEVRTALLEIFVGELLLAIIGVHAMAGLLQSLPMFKNSGHDAKRLPTVFEQMNAELWEDVHRRKTHPAASPRFNLAVGAAILINAILIGIEVDYGRGDKMEDRQVFFIFDVFFSLGFFVEMLVRQNQLGWDYFLDPWNVFDYVLVVLSCVDLAVSISDEGSMAAVRIIRLLRLLRIVRNIRGIRMFRELWMIIQGLLDSLRTMGWVSLLLFMIVYCISVVLTTTVGQSDYVKEHWIYSQQYVGTVYRSMWTVIQLITFDNWATDIARPMSEVSPITTWICIATITVCTFGVLNVIIAVMVERTLTIAKENRDIIGGVLEKTEKELLKSMAEDFFALDEDGSGELDFDEFQKLIHTPNFSFKLRLLGIFEDEAESLFELMDADSSGTVSPEEFIAGLQKLKGPAKGQDLVQLISFAQKQSSRASRFCERITKLSTKADKIQARLNSIGTGLSGELRDRKAASYRKDDVWRKAAERQTVIGRLDADRRLKFPGVRTDQM